MVSFVSDTLVLARLFNVRTLSHLPHFHGTWERYPSICVLSPSLFIRLYVFAMLAALPATILKLKSPARACGGYPHPGQLPMVVLQCSNDCWSACPGNEYIVVHLPLSMSPLGSVPVVGLCTLYIHGQ